MNIGAVRFIYVPAACTHGAPWDAPCGECDGLRDALASQGTSAIPRNVMAVGVLMETLNAPGHSLALPPAQPLLAGEIND